MARYVDYAQKTKPDDLDAILIADNEADPDTLKQILVKSLFESYDATAFDGAYKTVKAAIESKMTRSTYDSTGNGIVDNSEKLENHAANYFATASALDSAVSELEDEIEAVASQPARFS